MASSVNAELRRKELVANAAELFDREGYHTTNVGEIAAAVGISKPTLYHYFSSKDEILYWIHEEFINLLIERQERRPSVGARDNLLECMSDVIELMQTHRGHVRTFFEHYRELSDEDQATIREKRDTYQGMIEAVIEQGIDEGDFRPVDARLVTLAIFGMCNWAYQWYRPDGPLTSREIAAFFFDLLVNGIGR